MSAFQWGKWSKVAAQSIANSNKRINIWEGSVRSGKTIASIVRFIHFVDSAPQDGLIFLVGKTERTIRRNIIDVIKTMLPSPKTVSYNRGLGILRIGKREIEVIGANDERSQEKIRGATVGGVYGDEITLWPESFFRMLLSRMSVEGAMFFGTTNPDSPYHWLKTDFLDRQHELDLARFHFTIEDNLNLAKGFVEALKTEYNGLWYKRFILGLWVLAEGVVYDMFSESRHVVDVQALLKERKKQQFRNYFVGVDYGTNNPCTFGLYGYDNGLPVYLVKEHYYDSAKTNRQKTDSQHADDFDQFIKGVPNLVNIYVDPSALSFISELRHRGYRVTGANNDVLDGIRFVGKLLSNGQLFVDKSCKNTIKEFAAYVWDAKAQAKGEDKPIKANDHCFVAGTMIETDRGSVPIEQVTTNDKVLTRDGYKKVLAAWMTSPAAEVADYAMPNGRVLTATSSHPVYTQNRGFVPIGQLMANDLLLCITDNLVSANNISEVECQQSLQDTKSKQLSLTGLSIADTKTRQVGLIECTSCAAPSTSQVACVICIGTNGHSLMARFQMAMKSIMQMAIHSTTTLRTWFLYLKRYIEQSMLEKVSGSIRRNGLIIWRALDRWLLHGIGRKKVSGGLEKSRFRTCMLAGQLKSSIANAVGPNMKPKMAPSLSFVPINANQNSGETLEPTTLLESASIAEKNFRSTSMTRPVFVLYRALENNGSKNKRIQAVYNLTVEDRPEFFANGVLVHNCLDALRYGLFTHFFRQFPTILKGLNYR